MNHSIALEIVKHELDAYNLLNINKAKIEDELDLLVYFYDIRVDYKFLKEFILFASLIVYVLFSIKLILLNAIGFFYSWIKVYFKKKKYKYIFLKENADLLNENNFLSSDLHSSQNTLAESKKSIVDENRSSFEQKLNKMIKRKVNILKERLLSNYKHYDMANLTSLLINIANMKKQNDAQTTENVSNLVKRMSINSTISNKDELAKEINKLADLYASFCANLECNYKSVLIPNSKIFLEWLYIKQSYDKKLDEMKKESKTIYNY